MLGQESRIWRVVQHSWCPVDLQLGKGLLRSVKMWPADIAGGSEGQFKLPRLEKN